jgi:hypothetical protein
MKMHYEMHDESHYEIHYEMHDESHYEMDDGKRPSWP